ncbi:MULTISPECIES: MerR family transcriptional regulator [unclassified Fusibacter]|uniref:MerR family transcriptional regulator n=1 Tax=unclassified Fusibacter TaxID=2624464 RepID=UPI0010125B0A|nr:MULTISPECIES: MerR family transcriptional regulator [unclassified Fusibacter]MCK8060089.1 MerR family transcriptional regulator [Fusibacter sp. A2]NPE22231.1 MerR family transcriptional regulator [Fusibacter sp. A1]RXV61005.1 MerR family transcriptional regulator [Fusibacter sp. A1]
MYTVKQIADLAGISARTIRYYDEIGLLNPSDETAKGYRLYDTNAVDTLQQILFFRELGVALEEIKALMDSPEYDKFEALVGHRKRIHEKKERLDKILNLLDKSIEYYNGGVEMNDQEKFEGMKRRLIEENDKKYGEEVSSRYGKEIYEASRKKVSGMSKEDFDGAALLEKSFLEQVMKAFEEGDPASESSMKAMQTHKEWLMHYWGTYSKEAHAGLGTTYVQDERFKAYYDKYRSGLAEFIHEALQEFTK